MASKTPDKKKMTDKEKQILKKTIVKMNIPEGHVVAYCLANKQSKSGLFSNERLLLLNSGEKSIRYYTNLPPQLPFTSHDQITEGKQKIYIESVKNFKCKPIKGKNSTMEIQWEIGNTKNSWIFGMGTPKVMHEWVALVDDMIDGKLRNPQFLIKQQQLQIKMQKQRIEEERRREEEKLRKEEEQRRIKDEERRRKEQARLRQQQQIRRQEEIRREEERLQQQRLQQKIRQQQKLKQSKTAVFHKQSKQSRIQQSQVYDYRREDSNRIEEQRMQEQMKLQEQRAKIRLQQQSRLREDEEERRKLIALQRANQEQQLRRREEERNRMSKVSNTQYRQLNRTQSQQHNFFLSRNTKQPESKKSFRPQNYNIRWNEIWWTSREPVQIHQKFINQCRQTACSIVQQLAFDKADRKYKPFKAESPYSIYIHDGIEYTLHCFSEEKNLTEDEGRNDLPVLFAHQTYEQAKREFYNYNFIMGVTGNKGFIKVPLCYYCEFKGVLVICKAMVPQSFKKTIPHQYEKQLQSLQQVLKVRFIFTQLSLHVQPQSKFLVLSSLPQLLPAISHMECAYYRRQLLMQLNDIVEDRSSIKQLNESITHMIIPQFIRKLQTLDFWIISSSDLLNQMHRVGINSGYLANLHSQTSCAYYKKVFITEMANEIFVQILRSQVNFAISTFPASQMRNITPEGIDEILLDCVHIMIDQLFSYSSKSQAIWRVIVTQIKRKYDVIISKEDILPGFLLGGIFYRFGIQCNFKDEAFSRDMEFFMKQKTIPRTLFYGFKLKQRRYDLDAMVQQLQLVDEILSSEPSPNNFQNLVRIFNLRKQQLPSYCTHLKKQIFPYMCNFVPFGDHQQYEHLGLYDALQIEPHTYYTTKTSLLAIKWAIKKKNEDLASKIFQVKFQESIFWISQFNPSLSQFYDLFSMYYASVANYEEGIKLAKSSLINVVKLLGVNGLPVSDKHYQLGNIFFKVGKKEQALKQYTKTKQILQHHKQTSIPEYGVILLKLSLLYLNFGKIIDCVSNALSALKVIDVNGGNEEDEIQTFQILARAYQITRKKADLLNVGSLCMQKFNQTDSPIIFQRMMKIILVPKLTIINPQDSKALLNILTKLERMESPLTYMEAFSYLRHRAEDEIVMKRVISYIDNISDMNDEVMRRDLFRKHRSLNYETQSESSEMLVVLETVATMVGYNFMLGCLRENYFG